MATSKLTPYFATINSSTVAVVNVDPDKYNTAVASDLGLTTTEPTAATTQIRLSRKGLNSTGKFIFLKARCSNGNKTRTVSLLCELTKVASAGVSLKGKSVTLGAGSNAKPWVIQNIVNS